MSGKLQNLILQQLYFRAPNWVSIPIILNELSGRFKEEKINDAVEKLLSSELIIKQEDLRESKGTPVTYLKLTSYEGLPIRDTIRVGGAEVHRIIETGSPRYIPEAFNNAIESLAEYNDELESRFKEIIKQEQAGYWKSVVSVFGIFVAILALVFTSVLKVEKIPSVGFWDNFLFNLAQILPLSIVLLILLLIIKVRN